MSRNDCRGDPPGAVSTLVHRQRRSRSQAQRRTGCRRSERGVATVWGLGWVLVCLSVGWISLLASGVVASQHHLDAAADLASLAAAARSQVGGDGCAAAREVAAGNGVQVVACADEGGDVIVTTKDTVALPFGLDGRLFSTARAGPAEVSSGRL